MDIIHHTTEKESNLMVQSVSLTLSHGDSKPIPLTKVLIEYPSDWKKGKRYKDGDVVSVSAESAKQFVTAGFASYVGETVKGKTSDFKEPKVKKDKIQ